MGSSPEKASNALKGVENQSYEGDNDDEDEEGRRGVAAAGGGQKYRLPVPDERIGLLPFEEMRTHYLQVVHIAGKQLETKTRIFLRLNMTMRVS